MPLVTFKDLCIDVVDLRPSADFWGSLLGLDVVPDDDDPDEVHLGGPTPQHTVWPCVVPEPKTVKDRVHLDVHSAVEVPPGTTRRSAPGEHRWTVVSGPEGDEICSFVREEVPAYRLYEVGVDAVDHVAITTWWQGVWGGVTDHRDPGFSGLADVPGVPFEGFAFASVPEPKTVKNRLHWDVTLEPGATVDDLVAAGATVLRAPDDEIVWTVMADPEGNEFCVFERADAGTEGSA